MPDGDGPSQSRIKRFAWFAALWAAGVLVVVAVAYVIRLIVGT